MNSFAVESAAAGRVGRFFVRVPGGPEPYAEIALAVASLWSWRKRRVQLGFCLEVGRVLAALTFGLIVYCSATLTLCAQQGESHITTAPNTEKSRLPCHFTDYDLWRFYLKTTYTPSALAGPVAGAALTGWITRNPPQWGQGFPGYGRRLLSGYSRQVIANSVGLGVALADHEDPRHYLTGERTIWRRGLFAAREAVASHNASGGLMPAYSRIIGAYAAGFASNAWYPKPYANVHDALYRGSTALASDIVWQEFKEFWPDVRHLVHPH